MVYSVVTSFHHACYMLCTPTVHVSILSRTMNSTNMAVDPLLVLPSELILRILEFTSSSSISQLTRLNKTWHSFIDEIHQDAIYSAKLAPSSSQKGFHDFSHFNTDS